MEMARISNNILPSVCYDAMGNTEMDAAHEKIGNSKIGRWRIWYGGGTLGFEKKGYNDNLMISIVTSD